MARQIYIADPAGVVPFRLGPGRHAPFFQSTISINSSGFRGKEILQPKGNAYRIVALGESTTFGCTLNPEDRPWPEWLEEIIARKLSPTRRVEVINAGVASYTLENNVDRLARDILPLKPDLIISYHGVNGFYRPRAGATRISGTALVAAGKRRAPD
jgi:lysophospholipase L1-like esterase